MLVARKVPEKVELLVSDQLGFSECSNVERGRTQATPHEIHGLGTGVGVGVKLVLGEDVSDSLGYQLRGGNKF